ncbi:4-oxalocrotonate decarboxylase [candidate division KSB3 bacterium]|uniref:4-oxalocrotonate decarboxylase n=1 Tax=candidate division KSB3 bacterium TaxID=2044937 RepID=A0A2G6E7R4_9BACT|nr:MAG: 4-oxalocrotonate decarboxylase [candidate division KSB3 bacterium]PIE30234.1 MAG: 4-oxalocrotonate decarboxylase [candidate division KSB3 bacterium]
MMKMRKILAVIMVLLCVGSSASAGEAELAELLLQAHEGKLPMPVLSMLAPDLDVTAAYAVQKAYVEKRLLSDRIAGFKAGLTSEAGQRKFGVNEPVAGILFASGKLTGTPILDRSAFTLLMLEVEFGFVFKDTISAQIKDIAELQEKVASVMPVIEIPDLAYTEMKQLKGVDIIASNVAAKQFLVGEAQDFRGQDINTVSVTLSRDGSELNTAKGSDALGDQWEAALWLVNTIIEQEWTLEAGQLIITGALGKMLPGKAGKYVADYGELGKIAFEVR